MAAYGGKWHSVDGSKKIPQREFACHLISTAVLARCGTGLNHIELLQRFATLH
jgi:hypothetical protein